MKYMKNKTSKNSAVTSFTLTEQHGGLPFIVMWIGLHKLPIIQHFETLKAAKEQYNKLTALGREPAILLDINHTEHWCQPDVKGRFKILIGDISFNIYGFRCEKIKHLTYEQHQKLSDELTKIGKSVMWTNTEEMDYLCVKWIGLDGCYPKKERNSICKILNYL